MLMSLKEMGCMERFKNLTNFVSVSTVTNPAPQQLKDLYENTLLCYGSDLVRMSSVIPLLVLR